MLTGTPSYFSPELARGESPGPPADVWALGATLYAAVEGRPPYQAQANPIAVLDDIARNQPSAPRRAGFLEPALLAMMARDPGARCTMDDARRNAMLGEACELTFNDVAIIPLHHEVSAWAARKGVTYATRADQYTLVMGVSQG